jgi:hypothetical protein
VPDQHQPITPDQFEAYRDMIRSGQIDQADVLKLLMENTEFAAWYRKQITGFDTRHSR